jgi:hypothetical protein
MATKVSFSTVEWNRLLESPLLACFAIGGSDPAAVLSTLNGGLANAPALAETRMDPSENQLVEAVIEELMTAEGRANAYDGVKDRALAALKQVSAILGAQTPADAAAFKAWLGRIALLAVEKRSESGALGFGGPQARGKDKAELAKISKVWRSDATIREVLRRVGRIPEDLVWLTIWNNQRFASALHCAEARGFASTCEPI